MSFNDPWNLLWLVPALGAITLLYLLRRPRRNIVVPCTLFWSLLPEQSVTSKRIQRFVPQLLFFLQILAAILLVGASAQPVVYTLQPPPRIWAVVIDNGGSMSATSGGRPRFEAAQGQAQTVLTHLISRFDPVILTTTAGNGELVSGPTSDHAAIIGTINSLKATDERSDVPAALALASAAIKRAVADHRSDVGGILLFSDDAFSSSDRSLAKAADGVPVQTWRPATDNDGPNLAITRLSVLRDSSQPNSKLDLFMVVSSTGSSERQRAKVVFTVNGSAVSQEQITVAPDMPAVLSATISAPAKESTLIATLTPSDKDILQRDNNAYAILPAAGSTKVLLVTDGDHALERALALLPGVTVDEASIANYQKYGAPGGYDAYVIDAGSLTIAASQLPGNSLIWGGNEKGLTANSSKAALEQTVDSDRSHPVMRFVDLGDVLLNSSSWSSIGAWHSLIENGNGTVLASLETPGRRAVRASFSPAQSGFESQATFPIFMSNAIAWLTEQAGRSDFAGTPISLEPVRGGWTVTHPDGDLAKGICTDQPNAPCADSDTGTAGIYRARSGSKTVTFARNFDPAASDTTPKARNLGIPPTHFVGPHRKEPEDVLPYVALACLTLLLVEWAVYHRGR